MNTFIKCTAISFLFVIFSGRVFSQQVLVGNIVVKLVWVQDPDIKASRAVERGRSDSLKWLQLDIDYTTRQSKQPWLDNVVIQYDVLLPKTIGRTAVVLSGSVDYWSIPMDGKVHHAQAFIHPKIFERYAPDLRMRKGELKKLRILVTVLQNGSPIGWGVYKMKSNTEARVVRMEVTKALSARETFKGADLVFGRDITPWGALNTGYYELIKRKK